MQIVSKKQTVIRPPVKWHGGKYYLAKRIISYFPKHSIYLEPFGGAASVLLNKYPAEVESYNDLNLKISRLFRVLQKDGQEFIKKLQFIPYSQYEFDMAASYPEKASDLEKSVCDYIRWRQSFGGQGRSWSYTTKRARGGRAGDVNAWWTAIDQLPYIIERLKDVQILHQPAIKAIERFDDSEALIYCDPPYLHETRSLNGRDIYEKEMSTEEHTELADVLNKCKSKVIISGYPSKLYSKLYNSWKKIQFDIANHSAGGKTKERKTETLWLNW